MTTFRQLAFALIVATATSATACAQHGDAEFGFGEAPRYAEIFGGEFHDLLDDADEPEITALGNDAVRFSSQPALGGVGYVIVLKAPGLAEVSWFYGHPRQGWRSTRRLELEIAKAEYEGVVEEVDRLLALGVSAAQDKADDAGGAERIVMCSDGPGLLTERIRDGEPSWLSPQCTGVNRDIDIFLRSWIFEHLG